MPIRIARHQVVRERSECNEAPVRADRDVVPTVTVTLHTRAHFIMIPTWDKLLTTIGTIGAPLVRIALKSGRANRRRAAISDYLALAEALEEHQQSSAPAVRMLVDDLVKRLVAGERTSMNRRLDSTAIVTLALLCTPGVVGVYTAFTHTDSWRWSVGILAALWGTLWIGVGLPKLWADGQAADDGADAGISRGERGLISHPRAHITSPAGQTVTFNGDASTEPTRAGSRHSFASVDTRSL